MLKKITSKKIKNKKWLMDDRQVNRFNRRIEAKTKEVLKTVEYYN
jgi:hypothetical protein